PASITALVIVIARGRRSRAPEQPASLARAPFEAAHPALQVLDVALEHVDVMDVEALVARLVECDLAHELPEVEKPLLDAAEAQIGLIEPLVGLIQAFVHPPKL